MVDRVDEVLDDHSLDTGIRLLVLEQFHHPYHDHLSGDLVLFLVLDQLLVHFHLGRFHLHLAYLCFTS
jgi:hypothetical protein